MKTYTCTACKQTKTEVIQANGGETECNHATTTVKNVQTATCTTAGYTGDTYCSECDELIQMGKEISATGHQWDAGIVTQQPTETENGVKTYTCNICNQTKTELIPATGETTGGTTTGGTTTETSKVDATQSTVYVTSNDQKIQTGDLVTDESSKATFRVTKTGAINKSVEYVISNANVELVVIPDKVVLNGKTYKVTAIADSAFKGNQTLKGVQIGKNVKTIGKNAFSGCKNLEEVVLSKNTTTIAEKAFYKCTSLTSITIPSKVSKIGKYAFYGCKNLKNITIKTKKLTSKTVTNKAFKGISSKATIKVPSSKLKAYKKLFKEKGLSSKVTVKK